MSRSPHDAAAVYGLDGLEGIERLGFESHMHFCPRCREDVEDIRDTAELLSVGITLDPPTELRARVLGCTEVVRA